MTNADIQDRLFVSLGAVPEKMIKSILDSDDTDTKSDPKSPAASASSGSILDLHIPPEPEPSLDPFAITDHHHRSVNNSGDQTSREADNSETHTAHAERPEADFLAPTTAETVRMSGLAWSAGIMFFGSVGFMLVLGWLVDTVLGSSPWGIVGGIVLGSIIGFVQLIRINTQILNTHSSAPRSLMDQAGADRPESIEAEVGTSPIADPKTEITPDFPSVADTPNTDAEYALENDSPSKETDDSPRPL